MKLKTDIEIKALAKLSAGEPLPDKDLIAQWKCYVGGYEKGANWMQQDLLASASEGFEEWWNSVMRPIAGVGEKQSCKESWQASKLSDAREIERLKEENKELRRELRSSSESFNALSATDAQLIEELKKENEELRVEIEKLKKSREYWMKQHDQEWLANHHRYYKGKE